VHKDYRAIAKLVVAHERQRLEFQLAAEGASLSNCRLPVPV
jgi:hypothetical protein